MKINVTEIKNTKMRQIVSLFW